MKRSAQDYGSKRPKVSQDDFDGDFTIVTIANVEDAEWEDDDGHKQKGLIVSFEETGDKSHWLNIGQIESLTEAFGDDDDDWKGKQVPLEKHTAEYRNRQYPKVRIPPVSEWEQMFRDAGERMPKLVKRAPESREASAPAKPVKGVKRGKTPAKRGGKR